MDKRNVFFNDTATTEIYTLSLHDALPICQRVMVEIRGSWQRSEGYSRTEVRESWQRSEGWSRDQRVVADIRGLEQRSESHGRGQRVGAEIRGFWKTF